MKIKQLTFTDGEDGAIPASGVVEMTIEEMAFFAVIAGMLTDSMKPKNFDAYDALVGDVFNRYWDDGVDGAIREIGVRRPPAFAKPV